jgi:hypothetical protein
VLEKARRAMEQRARGSRVEHEPTEPIAPSPESLAASEPTPPPTPAIPTPLPIEPLRPAISPTPASVPAFSTTPVMTAPVISEGPNGVVLSLFLNVVSVQLTPELRMGSIRARPSTGEVSLHVQSPGVRAQLPETGFTLGPVGLDDKGRIATVRLLPTSTPFKASPTQHSLQIGSVSVVPIDSTNRMQLTPMAGAPMTLQLVAQLELAGVELSPLFQVAQIVLKSRGLPIRVTINSGNGDSGTACETVDVLIDHSARLKELLLNPVH